MITSTYVCVKVLSKKSALVPTQKAREPHLDRSFPIGSKCMRVLSDLYKIYAPCTMRVASVRYLAAAARRSRVVEDDARTLGSGGARRDLYGILA